MKSEEFILKTFQVKKTNSHLKKYLIQQKTSQNQLAKSKIRRCWAAAYQRLQKYSDTRKISVKRIYLADLKIGCTKSVA